MLVAAGGYVLVSTALCRSASEAASPPRRDTSGVFVPPETRYARSGDGYIAYQVWGEGPVDLVVGGSSVSWPVDLLWHEPRAAHALERLGGFARRR